MDFKLFKHFQSKADRYSNAATKLILFIQNNSESLSRSIIKRIRVKIDYIYSRLFYFRNIMVDLIVNPNYKEKYVF